MKRILLLVLLAGLLPAQVVIRVPGDFATVAAAADAARGLGDAGTSAPGDYVIIEIAAGTFVEPVPIGLGMITHVKGAGAGLTTIDGQSGIATFTLPISGGPVPVIQGVTITGNGHGIYADGGGATVVDCVFDGCVASVDTFGGSAGRLDFATVDFVRCTFTNCGGPRVLGGLPSAIRIIGCRFLGNAGSGVSLDFGTVVDSVFAGNVGTAVGFPFDSTGIELRRCTLWGNGTGISGGGPFDVPVIRDVIIWGNTTQVSGSADVAWSIVEGGWPGATNLDVDPQLVDPTNGDFALAPGSPAIDSGDPSGEIDPDGSRLDRGYRPGLPFLPAAAIGSAHIPGISVFAPAPYSSLTVDGSGGGLDRRVDRAVGEAFTIAWSEPWPFMIGGLLGVPGFDDQLLLDGIGITAFPPCWPPYTTPATFTLTNNVTPDPCAFFPSAPGPWSLTFPQGLAVPMQITLQGWFVKTETGPPALTYVRASNAVLLNVY